MTGGPAGALADVRAIADAVLYEGYLLYPYRASSRKNQVRWQFGVLGPPGAVAAGDGEEPDMATECLLRAAPRADVHITVTLRFLQLQARVVEERSGAGFVPVPALVVGGREHTTWDEAVEVERTLGTFALEALTTSEVVVGVDVPGGEDVEQVGSASESGVAAGRVVRRRRALRAEVALRATMVGGGLVRLGVHARNTHDPVEGGASEAISVSLIGTHLVLQCTAAEFVSLRDPGQAAGEAAATCRQHRCWPVLAGQVVLVSPIILDDHPQLAPESRGALFDSTEIDEILTLRVLTLTEQEKAEARATDPRAAEIIDRCEQMSPDDLAALHGALRDPRAGTRIQPDWDVPVFAEPVCAEPGSHEPADQRPWWDPAVDASVDPSRDSVLVRGVPVARDSRVRIVPTRRADAQDMFLAGQVARVAGVHRDVDGGTHVAVVLDADPAADLHEWYGRYLYFAPDELEPLEPSGAVGPSAPNEGDRPWQSSG